MLPSIFEFKIISTNWLLSDWLRLGPLAKPSPEIFLLWSLSFYQNLYMLLNAAFHTLYFCLPTTIHIHLLTILPYYFSKTTPRSSNIKNLGKTYQCILSYMILSPLFHLFCVALTFFDPFPVCSFDLCVGRVKPGWSSVALTSCCSGLSDSLMPLPSTISNSSSSTKLSSLSFGVFKSPFQLCQCSVSDMLPGALFRSLSAGWWLIICIRWTFNTWVRPPRRSASDTAGDIGYRSDTLNAATPSCWKFDQDALNISWVSEMHPIAVICLCWARDSFCVALRFWLPCHISQKSWTFAILFNLLSCTFPFISKLISVIVISNTGSSPTNIPLLTWANCLTMTFLWSV